MGYVDSGLLIMRFDVYLYTTFSRAPFQGTYLPTFLSFLSGCNVSAIVARKAAAGKKIKISRFPCNE